MVHLNMKILVIFCLISVVIGAPLVPQEGQGNKFLPIKSVLNIKRLNVQGLRFKR